MDYSVYILFELIRKDGSVTRLINSGPGSKSRPEVYLDGNIWLSCPVVLRGVEKTTDTVPNISLQFVIPKTLRSPFNTNNLVEQGTGVRRTFTDTRSLDFINFYMAGLPLPSQQPLPLSSNTLKQDYYVVDRITEQAYPSIKANVRSLASSWDYIFRPRVGGRCYHAYRGSDCGYRGNRYFDVAGNSVASRADDVCGLTIKDCEKRFPTGDLPYGGIPDQVTGRATG